MKKSGETGLNEHFHKKTFENIPAEKRERILNIAITEFASKGYNAASINTIARNAGISIGGMYRYFESKEALIMTVLDRGYVLLEKALKEIVEMEGDILTRIEAMLRTSMAYAREYREINQIYLDVSTEGLSSLAGRISLKMEGITSELYRKSLEEAKAEGIVRGEVHPGILAFCLDNLVMMVQFSCASAYYRERLKIYAGEDVADDDDALIEGIMDFVKYGLLKI
ncbi:MAG: TetR/AcrR family transcriptional regulator [Spirochaetales bacterium]|nr:TetR/AcrR family transcriptional regulator [Spirochaetales bacterium]